ncbi:hypothetical protein [Streptomyces sp. NBC_01431]|uniref:hypothetical protein n=1 Tax=Streptomyces sp. NBC_01431 TaxID=2903863 RepID=UPI002E368A61|nr:hypothetical protein [Streptomyces sp. NBC_01431]
MSEPESIVPSGIPQFTGDLDSLDHDTALLTTEAGSFRDAGAGIHSNFQGVAAFYKAPEAEQLFATTAPVAAKTATFADNLEKVSAALSTYSQEVRPLAKKLEDLQRQAFAFTASIAGDDHWQRDEKKRDRNDGLKNEVQATLQAFYEAEIACHNKITALVGGTTLVLGSYGEQKIVRMGTVEYGARAEDLSHMDKLPWGNYAEPEYTGLNWWWHQGKSLVWDGFIVDGIWGTVTGIDILLGCDGWDSAWGAWKGLAKVATGLAIMITPGANGMFLATPASMMPKWFRESRTALKETGKALIAYDQWGKNPARAAGGVTFNVLTTIFTGGAGTAAKGGAVAKTVSVLGKVGRAVDPMTYVFKAGKFGVGKVGDLFATLKSLNSGASTDILSSAGHLQTDGTYVKFADDVPVIKGDTLEWPGGARLNLKEGTVTLADGTKSAAHIELSAADRAALENSLPHAAEASLPGTKAPVLVAAAERAGHGTLDNATRDSIAGPTAAHEPPAGRGGDSLATHDNGGGGRSSHTAHPASADGMTSGSGTGRGHSPSGHGSGSGSHGTGGTGHDGSGGERELSTAERKAIQDEHVRKANEDPAWYAKHYDIIGRRRKHIGKVDGVDLPQLAKDAQGDWIAKHDMPSGPSETRFGAKPLGRETAPDHVLPTLDRSTADRQAYRELMNAQSAFEKTPSVPHQEALDAAQKAYTKQLVDVPPNSKISEKLGELASQLHVIPHEFTIREAIDLPKTTNGAHTFDGAYRINKDEILIAEDKAPGNDLDWRQGRADPEDPKNPHLGDNGGAAGMRVKQGTPPYLRTIFAEMTRRGGRDAELAREFRNAYKAGKLKYVLVKVIEPDGNRYAGAVLEHMKIYSEGGPHGRPNSPS